MSSPSFAFAICTEQSQEYQNIKAELGTELTIQDIYYANKKYIGKNLSAKIDTGMKDCKCLLVFCTADFKTFMDEKKGGSKCTLPLGKDEKSIFEKGFKKHKDKIILINFKGDDASKIQPKCLSEHAMSSASTKDDMDIVKDKMKMKVTQANIKKK